MQFLEDMSEDDNINPNEWTTKELVKHLFREQKATNEQLAKQDKVLRSIEAYQNKQRGQSALIGGLTGFITAILTIIANYLKTH